VAEIVTDPAQKTIHIKYVRSGIGFDFHTKVMIRSLGLRHLHQVVERQNTPQIRGLVAKIPHFVEIVKPQPTPAWILTPEFTLFPPEPKPERVKPPVEAGSGAGERSEEVLSAAGTADTHAHQKSKKAGAAHSESGKHKKSAKHAEPAKHAAHATKEKGKAAKTEHVKKHGKAADAKHAKHAKHDTHSKKGKK
jgi:large subunit ribosomal protein L30